MMRSYFLTRVHRRFVIKYFGSESSVLLVSLQITGTENAVGLNLRRCSLKGNKLCCTCDVLTWCRYKKFTALAVGRMFDCVCCWFTTFQKGSCNITLQIWFVQDFIFVDFSPWMPDTVYPSVAIFEASLFVLCDLAWHTYHWFLISCDNSPELSRSIMMITAPPTTLNISPK